MVLETALYPVKSTAEEGTETLTHCTLPGKINCWRRHWDIETLYFTWQNQLLEKALRHWDIVLYLAKSTAGEGTETLKHCTLPGKINCWRRHWDIETLYSTWQNQLLEEALRHWDIVLYLAKSTAGEGTETLKHCTLPGKINCWRRHWDIETLYFTWQNQLLEKALRHWNIVLYLAKSTAGEGTETWTHCTLPGKINCWRRHWDIVLYLAKLTARDGTQTLYSTWQNQLLAEALRHWHIVLYLAKSTAGGGTETLRHCTLPGKINCWRRHWDIETLYSTWQN